MTPRTDETSRQRFARLAGFAMLLYMAAGLSNEALHGRVGGEGVHAALASVAEHAFSLRLALLLELLECFCALALAVTLYGITRDEGQELALLGLVCRAGEGVLGALGIRKTLGLLWLAKGGAPASANALAALLLMPAQSAMIGAPFFALGSLAFAWLLLRGGIVPAPLARLGVFASALLAVSMPLQLAGFLEGPMAGWLWLPMVVYQIPLGLWLLAKGTASTGSRPA